jgi:hypothetical protein
MHYGMQRPPAYDLTLRFNEQISAEFALEVLWGHPSLDGPYSGSKPPERIPVSAYFSQEAPEGYGNASITGAEPVKCVVAYELWPDAPAKVLRVSLQASDAAPHLDAVDAWMVELAKWVWRELPFEVGVVADSFVSDWTGEGFWPELPLRRSFGLLWPDGDSEPTWHPPVS